MASFKKLSPLIYAKKKCAKMANVFWSGWAGINKKKSY